MSHPTQTRPRRRWLRAAGLLGATASALLFAEAFLYKFAPQATYSQVTENSPQVWMASATMPCALRPLSSGPLRRRDFKTTVHINSLGYRDDELARERGRAFRVLAVGDSFTFGWGVEAAETWSSRLERHLAGAGVEAEAINAGFAAGYYPDSYYLYLKERGLDLDPDIVVVGFFVGNDIDVPTDIDTRWTGIDPDGLPTRIASIDITATDGFLVPRLNRLRYDLPLVRDAHVFQLVAGAVARALPQPPAYPPDAGPEADVPPVYRRNWTARTTSYLRRVERMLAAMRRITEERGIQLVILLIPDLNQVTPDLSPFTAKADMGKPQRVIRAFLDGAGIDVLDLYPRFRAEGARLPLYHPQDWHWNRDGHDLAAGELAEHLLCRDAFAGR